MLRLLWIIGILSVIMCAPAHASWLSEVSGIDVKIRSSGSSVKINRPKPEKIPEAIKHFPNDVKNFLNPFGTTLAIAIRDARSNVRPNAKPIPPAVRQALSPYFPSTILNKVRWSKRSQSGFGLDSLVLKVGDADAITLSDTIVFRMGDPTSNSDENLELWAHELTHVLQYQNMGIDAFANMYSINWSEMEEQAKDNAAGIRKQIENGNTKIQFSTDNYSNFANVGSYQLSLQQFQQAAIQTIPPEQCVQWQQSHFGMNIQNICNINLTILGITKIDPFSGTPYNLPCNFNCLVLAGQSMAFQSPQPGQLVNVGFIFVQ